MKEQQNQDDPIHILLVDDEEKLCIRLARILAKDGYEIDTAFNGNDAIKLIDTKQYDIILTDLNMPDKNGFELMEYTRDHHIDSLILVLTGYASVDAAIQSIKLGAYDFIQKPIDVETFKLTIRRAADTVRLKQENVRNLQELKKLNELKNEFISVVSHDLRSPLATIGAYVNYLMKKGDLNERQHRYLGIIRDISDNLYSLVNELLDISKIESGIIQLNYETTDINELVQISINNFKILAQDKNNKIIYQSNLEDSTITIDRIKILQVLNNIISNAIKFTENGTITIHTRSTGNRIQVSIDDTGTGIDDEDIKDIFDEFSYLQRNGTRGESGSGLGMVICKRFIELHNGEIDVESKPGEGSRFIVTLPVSFEDKDESLKTN